MNIYSCGCNNPHIVQVWQKSKDCKDGCGELLYVNILNFSVAREESLESEDFNLWACTHCKKIAPYGDFSIG